ncbi:MAG: hypothetical protein K5662_01195 [Lachnospiraceae bacterium]|nr:hypothetical protein [Lachnospiraceae bacterium]
MKLKTKSGLSGVRKRRIVDRGRVRSFFHSLRFEMLLGGGLLTMLGSLMSMMLLMAVFRVSGAMPGMGAGAVTVAMLIIAVTAGAIGAGLGLARGVRSFRDVRAVQKRLDDLNRNNGRGSVIPQTIMEEESELGCFARGIEELAGRYTELSDRILYNAGVITDSLDKSLSSMNEVAGKSDITYRSMKNLSAGMQGNAASIEALRNAMEGLSHEAVVARECIGNSLSRAGDLSRKAEGVLEVQLSSGGRIADSYRDMLKAMKASIIDSEVIDRINSLTDECMAVTQDAGMLAFNSGLEAASAGNNNQDFTAVTGKLGNFARRVQNIINEINAEISGFDEAVVKMNTVMLQACELMQNSAIRDYEQFAELTAVYRKDALDMLRNVEQISLSTDRLAEAVVRVDDTMTKMGEAAAASVRVGMDAMQCIGELNMLANENKNSTGECLDAARELRAVVDSLSDND